MPVICRRSITLKNGKVLIASDYGKQAFCFEVDEERPKVSKKAPPTKVTPDSTN